MVVSHIMPPEHVVVSQDMHPDIDHPVVSQNMLPLEQRVGPRGRGRRGGIVCDQSNATHSLCLRKRCLIENPLEEIRNNRKEVEKQIAIPQKETNMEGAAKNSTPEKLTEI